MLASIFTQYWHFLALRAACKLGVFDALEAGEKTQQILAEQLGADAVALGLLLAFLQAEGYLSQSAAGDFFLKEQGALLCSKHPAGWHYACLLWGGEHLTAWQNLDTSIRSGGSSFELLYGCGYFEYLDQNPNLLVEYQKAMREYALRDYADLGALLDWGRHTCIMDVGGGYGAALESIRRRFPALKYLLFDRESVVRTAPALEGIEKIGGDFFAAPLPQGADAILLCRVLHDWADEQAIQILRRCYEALPAGGCLYVVENEKGASADGLHLLSLNMLAICKSYEREGEAYRKLAEGAGFRWQETIGFVQGRAVWKFLK